MEFIFLPRVVALRNPGSVRYAIKTFYASERQAYANSGFCYIGKNSDNIEKLFKVFKKGYASEGIENAKVELRRTLDQKNNALPQIIFFESSLGFNAIKNFHQFISQRQELSGIPLVLEGNHLSEKELAVYRKHKLFDEILALGEMDERSVLEKERFLKKIKAKGNEIKIQYDLKGFSNKFSFSNILKRCFDIIVSSIALIVACPIFLLIATAIRIESKGPVFYISKRAGRGYRIFNFYKFRTMFVGADEKIADFYHLNQYNAGLSETPVFIKINNDPRVTKIGAFLRNSSLDELPQLLNVLLGDMSLVGNRPLPLYEAATLTTDEWAARFMAPAGITGLWQIKKRGKEDMSVEERINLDIVYANKSNFAYDLWIMANTPSALFQKTNV